MAIKTRTTYVTPETAVDSAVISAVPCILLDLQVINTSASERYVMLFDSITVPADNTDPDWRGVVAAGAQVSLTFEGGGENDNPGKSFTTGLSVALSSTLDDLTVTVATEAYFQAELKA